MQLQSAFCEVGFQCFYIYYIIVTLQRAETGPSFRFCWYNGDNFNDSLQFTGQAWMADTLFCAAAPAAAADDDVENLLHENKQRIM